MKYINFSGRKISIQDARTLQTGCLKVVKELTEHISKNGFSCSLSGIATMSEKARIIKDVQDAIEDEIRDTIGKTNDILKKVNCFGLGGLLPAKQALQETYPNLKSMNLSKLNESEIQILKDYCERQNW